MTILTPIVNEGLLYINRMIVARESTTTLSVGGGQCRDSTNVRDISIASSITINAAVNGANGLDTGSLGVSKWYYVYAIADSHELKVPATLLSLSATAPLLPAGYDTFRRISQWPTNASSELVAGSQVGNNNWRRHWHTAGISVLSGGAATTATPINLSAAVPPLAETNVVLDVSFTPNVAAEFVTFSTAVRLSGSVAAVAQLAQVEAFAFLSSGNATTNYTNSAASGATTVLVVGYDYVV